MAVEETGFGLQEDKEIKNRFAALTLYDAIKDERTHGILAEDREKRTIDIGVPVGIVAGLVPSTNPTSTVIYKAMICLKAGNPIIFSPHPSAVNCILETVNVVRRAAESGGAPAGCVSCITIPTMEATDNLMKHHDTRLILATGGGAMVKARPIPPALPPSVWGRATGPPISTKPLTCPWRSSAFWTPKPLTTAPSAPPSSPLWCDKDMEPAVTAELKGQGAYVLSDEEHKKLSRFILRANGTMNPAIVGKSVETVAKLAGLDGMPRHRPGAGGPGDRRGPGLSLFQ